MQVTQRGRAIVRKLAPHDVTRTFRPGDFLLTCETSGLARLTGWATGCDLNHVALIVDPLGTVVEANPAFLRGGFALRSTSIGEYLRAGRPCWIGYVEYPHSEQNGESARRAVVRFAEQALHARALAGLAGRLTLAAHLLGAIAPRVWLARVPWLAPLGALWERLALTVRAERFASSAEFVAQALERGGFQWGADPALLTPADLWRRWRLIEDPLPLATLKARTASRSALGARQPERVKRGADPDDNMRVFAPRATSGAHALAPAPAHETLPATGLRALIGVGVAVSLALAFASLMDELLRTLRTS